MLYFPLVNLISFIVHIGLSQGYSQNGFGFTKTVVKTKIGKVPKLRLLKMWV